jgi:hypothetical protein
MEQGHYDNPNGHEPEREPNHEHAETDADAARSPVDEGIETYGDAFRAFLWLPDTDPRSADLLASFREFYVGSFASMNELIDELTEVRQWQAAIDELAAGLGFTGLVFLDRERIAALAHDAWDIVPIDGRLYVFNK